MRFGRVDRLSLLPLRFILKELATTPEEFLHRPNILSQPLVHSTNNIDSSQLLSISKHYRRQDRLVSIHQVHKPQERLL